jgi:hypothetical protein
MHYRATTILFVSLALATAAQVRAGEVERWNRVATDVSAAANTDPLTESRVFSIMHAAMHDALNAIDRRYEPYGAEVTAVPGASPDAAVAAAAHAVLVELMPAQKRAFDAALSRVDQRGAELGRRVAAALLAQRRDDGANSPISWPAGKKVGEYRPTPPDFTPALFAHWGAIRPFVLASSAQFRPDAPYAVPSKEARAEREEVRRIGGQGSTLRTAEQSEIARYWYEHSTQGWNRIAREVAKSRQLDEWQSARLFTLVNFAMADGFIGGFEAKYHYNYWRPATAIRENARSSGDGSWLSYLGTPPVPDYPSTHTVLGAAAATVLARFFGSDFVPFAMTSGAPFDGITRRFWSFSEAAQENGASRVFAGVHFASAVTAGYLQGERIGAWAYDNALRPVRPD